MPRARTLNCLEVSAPTYTQIETHTQSGGRQSLEQLYLKMGSETVRMRAQQTSSTKHKKLFEK